LSETVASPNRTPPPLTKARHGCVVHSHFSVQAPDAPPGSAKSDAQLRIFGGNQISSKGTHLLESVGTHQRITSAALGLSDRGIPLDVAEHVVNRSCRIELPTSATNNRYIAVSVKKGRRLVDPVSHNFAITIDKLDIGKTSRRLAGALKTRVSGARSAKGNSSI
jgi:hypothetical protein